MKWHYRCSGLLGFVVLSAVLANPSLVQTQTKDAAALALPLADKGVEILARGPVHEAYAEPVGEKPRTSPLAPKQPPQPVEEVTPDQKPTGDKVRWIPGYWNWDDDRKEFVWVSGFWRNPPPNRRWVPGHWKEASGAWQWTPGFWAEKEQADLNYLPEPPKTLEAGPSVPPPTENHVYVPGCWLHRNSRYCWRPGFWTIGRQNWIWVPDHYVWSPCGYVYLSGYWDYTLENRGVLFAPYAVQVAQFRACGWRYQPTCIVQPSVIAGALFARPGHCHYYFGDYFDLGSIACGYRPWCHLRIGGLRYDPIYSYCRWDHRRDPHWAGGLHNLYAARYRGDLARPARTLVKQRHQLARQGKGAKVNQTKFKNAMVSRLAQNPGVLSSLNRPGSRLVPVNDTRRKAAQDSTKAFRRASQERFQREAKIVANRPAQAVSGRPPASGRGQASGLTRTPSRGGASTAPQPSASRLVRPPTYTRPAPKPSAKPPTRTLRPPTYTRPTPTPRAKPPTRIVRPSLPTYTRPGPSVKPPSRTVRPSLPTYTRPSPTVKPPTRTYRPSVPRYTRPAPKPSAPRVTSSRPSSSSRFVRPPSRSPSRSQIRSSRPQIRSTPSRSPSRSRSMPSRGRGRR